MPILYWYSICLQQLLFFYGFMKSRTDGLMILSGLLAGYSAWVKNEGLLFIVVFVIVSLLAAWKKVISWNALKYLAVGLLIPIATVTIFKLVVESQNDIMGSNVSILQQLSDLSRWSLIAKGLAAHTLGYANWPISIVLILLIYALIMGFDTRETPYQVLLLLIALGQIAGYFFIYLIPPHDLQIHISTSIKRLVFHVFPIVILWLFVALHPPQLKGKLPE